MINIEKLIEVIPKGNKTALETLKILYPDEYGEYECKQWFQNEILNKLVKKVDEEKYSNWVFYFINNKCFMGLRFDQDGKNDVFWVGYEDCWEVFEDKFHYNYYETQRIIKGAIEEHFKMRCTTPQKVYIHNGGAVEKHFKMRCVTLKTQLANWDLLVKKHFKAK